MQAVNLPIHIGMVKAVDEVGLRTHSAAMIDVYVDELGGVNRRPGLVPFIDLGTSAAIDGLFWWEAQDWALAISNGNTYKITASDGTYSQITHTNTNFAVGTRATFADFGTSIYAANGAKIKEIPNTGNVIDMADADAPTLVTHVAFLDKYLLANQNGTRQCHHSKNGYPNLWGSGDLGGVFSKEAQYDNLQAIMAANLELYLLGDRTLEAYYNDGSSPFSRESQGFVQSGTVAKYSLAYCGTPVNSLVWVDDNRNIVRLSGRTPIVLSDTMTKYLQSYSTITDAIGDFATIAGRPYYILHLPIEGETLVYDFTTSRLLNMPMWYQWGYWNSGTATYERWRGNCYCHAQAWGFDLVGDRANGKIYKLSNTTYTDNSDTLRSLVRTGIIDHGMPTVRKSSVMLDLRIKRTQIAEEASALSMLMRYRDNGNTSWSNYKTITLTANSGETDYHARIRRLGSYYSRQWEFVLTDDVALSFVQAQEWIE